MQAVFQFPQNFLWGSATSSYQVEGQINQCNWSEWEKRSGKIENGDKAGVACGWRMGKWRDDFDRAAESDQNTLRISIEWSKIQPTLDSWDENELDFYREMVRGILSRGMKPLVTLHHFTDPLWFTNLGGWENEQAPLFFQKYAEKVVTALKSLNSFWVTINEPNVYTWNGYFYGTFPPGKKNNFWAIFRVYTHLTQAHAAAYASIHALQPDAKVGIALHYRGFEPKPGNPINGLIASAIDHLFNKSFINTLDSGILNMGYARKRLPKVRSTMDFVGINYYTASYVMLTSDPSKIAYPEGALLSDSGFLANRPDIFFDALCWTRRFNLPVYVTENGFENHEDSGRRQYLGEHVQAMWRAINMGVPVKGYYHWSLTDNFEWESGWNKRFGLWALDHETQSRSRRSSVDFYQSICKKNALSADDLEHWAPQSAEKIFRFI